MDERVARLKTPEDCEQFARNVLERNRLDLAGEARKRAVKLRAEAYGAKTQVERECLEAVYAYEEVLTAKNGRKTRASITWQIIRRHGVLTAVEHAVNREAEFAHHTALLEMGLQDHAFEAVVVRHPEFFSAHTVQRSRKRVEEWMRTCT
ncbi:MAG: hypothetical protein A3G24_20695 [Betaproteobacteria bacterium RIFCSPLOWO2_12_FULL_62_13]|nr:MAG: hypothetical protein A3G24_20695 [Betaproteobacteria bacterium RIFCSPLOWO2_12_FULL_62_13]